jgi:hypothetical protein
MPWAPELFTAPAQQALLDRRRLNKLLSVPFFDGLSMGEPDALVESFAGAPELYDPVRGRIKGEPAFREFVDEMSAWLAEHHVTVDDVERIILGPGAFEEVVLHYDGESGRADLPWVAVTDHAADGRIAEMRIYYSARLLTGRHAERPPLLQHDRALRESDVVDEYQRALAAGDVDAIMATFEPGGSVREAAADALHTGPDRLRAFYETLFADGGGIPLDLCAFVDDGRACALEYNVVQSGGAPQAGLVVCIRGRSGKLAAVRLYDD